MPIQGVLNKARVPVKIWDKIENVESSALTQLTNVANLPFVFKHVAVMPDVHLGKGATVGSVIAMKGAVVAACIGVDIGCGMMAVKVDVKKEKILDQLKNIRRAIEEVVPVGPEGNKTLTTSVKRWPGWEEWDGLARADKDLRRRAECQLGSLGGGNHFIEICLDRGEKCPSYIPDDPGWMDCGPLGVNPCGCSDNHTVKGPGIINQSVWVMLHSGSRNVGKTLAERHIDTAKGIMKKLFISLPDPELAYFAEGTPEFDAYMTDLNWCQDYAAKNRVEMMEKILKAISDTALGGYPMKRVMEVNCHHNYASREHHYGENVIITRKGAVRARAGDLGIIPGSMGAKSYIVEGLGNPESFFSCSHGAGRKMSRSAAKRQFTLDDLKKQTAGVECEITEDVIDEIPEAYKDIDTVMANQTDLVRIVAELKQVMCVKG